MNRLFRAAMLLLVRLLGAPGVHRARRQLHRTQFGASRILLIRPDHFGDVVLATPVIQAVKRRLPHAQITMMVGPWSQEVIAGHPDLDHIWAFPFPGLQRGRSASPLSYLSLMRLAEQVRGERYDVAINLRPGFWWGTALLYLAAVPRRVGYGSGAETPLLTHALLYDLTEHSTRSNLRLISAGLQALGCHALDEPYTPERYPLYFRPAPDDAVWVGGACLRQGSRPKPP